MISLSKLTLLSSAQKCKGQATAEGKEREPGDSVGQIAGISSSKNLRGSERIFVFTSSFVWFIHARPSDPTVLFCTEAEGESDFSEGNGRELGRKCSFRRDR